MRFTVLALLLALVAAPLSGISAQEQDENPAYGVWMTDGDKSKVHVHKCDGGLCSKIIWLKRALDTDGLPQLDELNQNVSLRKRPVVGINILEGMTQTARYEWEGEVYNPEDGKSYKAYLALIKPDVLRLKGCMPMGWPCRSKFWKKLDEEPPGDRPDTIMAAPGQEQLGEAPRQLANNAVAPQGQPEVTTQSVTEGAPRPLQAPAQRPADIARAPQPQPAAPPQALTPPRQLTPPPPAAPRQQAAPEPAAPPQQATRVPDIPPPPPLPRIAQQPAPQAAPPVVAQRPPPPPVAPRQQAAIPAPPPPPAPQALPQQPAPEGRRFAALPPTAPSRPQSDDGERYLVQVAARQNKKEAMDVFYDLRRRYPQLLGRAEPIIMKVDLGDLGIWYRVRVGPITGKSAALAFCNRLKFAGSDCFIRRQ